MKLMYAPQSPFARKIRIAAIELGLDDQVELVPTTVAPTKENSDYATTVNPLRKIPALVLEDGRPIYDSTVICEYLDSLAGGGRIIPASGPDRLDVLTCHALAQGMAESAVLVRYETWLRPAELRWADYVEDQWDRIESGLDWFESNAKSLEGPMNIAHIMLACVIGYIDFRWPESGWRDGRTRLSNWSDWIARRDSIKQTTPHDF